jgi:hypothetical protein
VASRAQTLEIKYQNRGNLLREKRKIK